MDFSVPSVRALHDVLSLAREYRAELTVLHVLEDFPSSKDLTTLTAEVVRQTEVILPRTAHRVCTIKSRLRVGRPY